MPRLDPSLPLAAPSSAWVGHVRRLVTGVIALVIVALLATIGSALLRQQGGAGGLGVHTESQTGLVRPGPAPDFQLQLYSGGSFRLSAQRGTPVLLNYWASWCPPCRDEAPVLERAWQRYRHRGVAFIGLDLWDTGQDARAFLTQYGVSYANGPDPRGAAAIDYGVSGIPETFFIRRDGTVARHWIGPLTDVQAGAFLDDVLP